MEIITTKKWEKKFFLKIKINKKNILKKYIIYVK